MDHPAHSAVYFCTACGYARKEKRPRTPKIITKIFFFSLDRIKSSK
jgi:hypothetical protein